jgi:hypothetical protein
MDEMAIKLDAYNTMKKELMDRFIEAFNDGFCAILENNIDEVLKNLKARENAN